MTEKPGIVEDLQRQLENIRDAVDDASQAEEDKRPINPDALAKVDWKGLQYNIQRVIDRLTHS